MTEKEERGGASLLFLCVVKVLSLPANRSSHVYGRRESDCNVFCACEKRRSRLFYLPAMMAPMAPKATSCAIYSAQNTQQRARDLLSYQWTSRSPRGAGK